MKKTICALALFTLVFASCKKDSTASITPTKENLAGTYIITAATVAANGQTVNVFDNADVSMNDFDPCKRDDQYKLNVDLSYAVIDAGTPCSPDNNATGTWELVNSSTISIDGSASTIKSWDGHTLVATADFGGGTYSVTYVKQ